jgi:uncharacterized protein YdhG (YjbR/CyaY superfamily)
MFEKHFKTVSPEVRARLEQIVTEVERRVPEAERCISYQMPAYRLGGVFIYFSAFKKHIGIYPPVNEPKHLLDRLAPFRGPKGNLIFLHTKPLPIDLIGEVITQLLAAYSSSKA